MKSMTGYGKGCAEAEGRKLTVELKAVNHRFLDLSVKLPKAFNFAEDALRKSVQERLSRGHVDIFVNYQDGREKAGGIKLDLAAADAYLDAAEQLKNRYRIADDFTLSSLMKCPGVVVECEDEDEEAVLKKMLLEAAAAAVDMLEKMRKQEGANLKSDMASKLVNIGLLLESIKGRAPLVAADYREKLKARLAEALSGVETDEARLINEVAFFTDRSSIDEEMTRLASHISHFSGICALSEPVGKRLDFLVQEMNREANTMGSKASDVELIGYVVQLKTEIEKVREQVQNVE